MRISFSTIVAACLASVALPALAVNEYARESEVKGSAFSRKHRDLAVLPRGDLQKRVDNARMTFYDITTGPVACEGHYQATDWVVALNKDQYGSYWKSSNCGRMLTISYHDKTARARVVDECPGCPWGGLDLTQGLFEYLAPLGEGVLNAQWWFD